MSTREQVDGRRRQVAALTEQGHSATEIAKQFSVTPETIRRDRKAIGIAQPPPIPLTDDQINQARRLLEDGCSYRETAKTVGCSMSVLHRRFPGQGWTLSQGASWGMYLRRTAS